jgi:prevent-host-death family protein
MARTITATEFRAKCLGLFDRVAETREPLLITKRGKPVAHLVPLPPEAGLIGSSEGTVPRDGDTPSLGSVD